MAFLKLAKAGHTADEDKRSIIIEDTRGMIDMPFLVLTLLLVSIGLIMMFSASYAWSLSVEGNSTHYFVRQLIFTVVGVGFMLLVTRVNYQALRALSFPILALSIFLLVIVLIIGDKINGAKRWIDLGFTTLQPSEIAKAAVVMSFSTLISKRKDPIKVFDKSILPYVGILGVILVLLIFEPHLSGMVIIVAIGVAMLFLGGLSPSWFAIGIPVALAAGYLIIQVMPHAQERIAMYQDPWIDPTDQGYQIIQSILAIASGGVLGLGLGNSRQKYLYLPFAHNDFTFSIVCEELGFIGALVVMLLFALLIIRGYWLAMHAYDKFGTLLVGGFTTLFALQVFFNIGVVTKLLPTTGISLPFFSYGGTALMIQLAEIGVILSVSRQNNSKRKGG